MDIADNIQYCEKALKELYHHIALREFDKAEEKCDEALFQIRLCKLWFRDAMPRLPHR